MQNKIKTQKKESEKNENIICKIWKRKQLSNSKTMGMKVEEIQEPEEIDEAIKNLKKEKYTTIVIPNELASFSQDIINKYKYDKKLNIIITP